MRGDLHAHAAAATDAKRARASVAQRSALDGALLPRSSDGRPRPDAPTPAAEPTLLDAWGGEGGGGGGVARREFISIPTQTNSVVRTGSKTVQHDHPDAAPLVLLSQVLSLGYLHREAPREGRREVVAAPPPTSAAAPSRSRRTF